VRAPAEARASGLTIRIASLIGFDSQVDLLLLEKVGELGHVEGLFGEGERAVVDDFASGVQEGCERGPAEP